MSQAPVDFGTNIATDIAITTTPEEPSGTLAPQGAEPEEAAGTVEAEASQEHAAQAGALGEKQTSSLLRGFDIDEASEKSVAEQLRDALSKHAVRVIDLFREWDEDGSGAVSKREFAKAMPMLGFDGSAEDVNALFDSMDPDGSGSLSLSELNKQLRRGAGVQLDASLQPGAVGEIETESSNKYALRKGEQQKTTSYLLRGFDIDEDSDVPVHLQLRDGLSKHAVRVIDLFREWDEDGSGAVSKREFAKAMPLLGFDGSKEDVNALFDSKKGG